MAGHPRAPRFVVALALVLALPSLAVGFFSDDYAFVDWLEHRIPNPLPGGISYSFTPSGPAAMGRRSPRANCRGGPRPRCTCTSCVRSRARSSRSTTRPSGAPPSAGICTPSRGTPCSSRGQPVLSPPAAARDGDARAPRVRALRCERLAVRVAVVAPYLARRDVRRPRRDAHVRLRRDGWGAGRLLGPLALVMGLLASEAALGGFAFAIA